MPGDALARCALAFVHQKSDGGFTTYVVDRQAFAGGRLSYVPIVRGRCRVDAAGVESCHADEQAAALSDTRDFYDVIVNKDALGIHVILHETLDSAQAKAEARLGYFSFFRCPFDLSVITSAFETEMPSWSEDMINTLRFPAQTILRDPLTLAIAKAVGAR